MNEQKAKEFVYFRLQAGNGRTYYYAIRPSSVQELVSMNEIGEIVHDLDFI